MDSFAKRLEQFKYLKEKAREYGVPEHTTEGLIDYIVDGIPPGGFLYAVLSNDLKEAFAHADSINTLFMKEIVSFLYSVAPCGSWGDRERVAQWLEDRRKEKEEVS